MELAVICYKDEGKLGHFEGGVYLQVYFLCQGKLIVFIYLRHEYVHIFWIGYLW